jgi:hypothetical protein
MITTWYPSTHSVRREVNLFPAGNDAQSILQTFKGPSARNGSQALLMMLRCNKAIIMQRRVATNHARGSRRGKLVWLPATATATTIQKVQQISRALFIVATHSTVLLFYRFIRDHDYWVARDHIVERFSSKGFNTVLVLEYMLVRNFLEGLLSPRCTRKLISWWQGSTIYSSEYCTDIEFVLLYSSTVLHFCSFRFPPAPADPLPILGIIFLTSLSHFSSK